MQPNEWAILIKLLTGAAATFFAILVWSRTREPAWIMIVLGTLCYYVNIVLETLENFGIVTKEIFFLMDNPVFRISLTNAQAFFCIIGFVLFIVRNKL